MTQANSKVPLEKRGIGTHLSALTSLVGSPPADTKKYLAVYLHLIKKISAEASHKNLIGLYELCKHYTQAIVALSEKGELSSDSKQVLSCWPALVKTYLTAPSSLQPRKALIGHLRQPCLSEYLTNFDADILMVTLDENAGEEVSISMSEMPDEEVSISIDEEVEEEISIDIGEAADEEVSISIDEEVEEEISIDIGQAANEEVSISIDEEVEEEISIDIGEAADEEVSISIDEEVEEEISIDIDEAADEEVSISIDEEVEEEISIDIGEAENEGEAGVSMDDVTVNELIDSGFSGAHQQSDSDSILVDNEISGTSQDSEIPTKDLEGIALLIPDAGPAEINLAKPDRSAQATAADVSLALPDDVDDEMLEIFLSELPDLIDEFLRATQKLLAGGTLEDLKVALRMAHTLQGSGKFIGVQGIANLAQYLELTLIEFSNAKKLPPQPFIQTMLKVTDCLTVMGEALVKREGAPDDAQEILQEILDWANQIQDKGLLTNSNDEPVVETSLVEASPESEIRQGVGLNEPVSAPTDKSNDSASIDHINTTDDLLNVSASLNRNLLRLSDNTALSTDQMQERLRHMTSQIKNLQAEFNRIRLLSAELERLASRSGESQTSELSELHTPSQELAEVVTLCDDLAEQVKRETVDLEEMLNDQDLLNREAKDAIQVVTRATIKPIEPE